MSIIIRLQNLPLSAKSEDIRRFFGGLRIPEGGVHILGGDKGDAFIAFNTDEDARLAMRKNEGKIHGTRVKLYLSSYMEMQHEVNRLTKDPMSNSPAGFRWESSGRRDMSRKSPVNRRSGNQDSFSSRQKRSRSPLSRRSGSPYDSRATARRRSRSSSPRQKRSRVSDISSLNQNSNVILKLHQQLQLEQKIAEAMNLIPGFSTSVGAQPESVLSHPVVQGISPAMNYPAFNQLTNIFPNTPVMPNMNIGESFQQAVPAFVPPSPNIHPGGFVATTNNPMLPVSAGMEPIAPSGFFVVLSNLDPLWSFSDIQSMAPGMFIPNHNIKFEVDGNGIKTGNAFIKLSNREDYVMLLADPTFIYNNKLIAVKECAPAAINFYFPPDYTKVIDNSDVCVRMGNLPYSVTFEEIIKFFGPCNVTDIYIVADANGKRDGVAFVSFENEDQFREALKLGGKVIGTRWIGITASNRSQALAIKRKFNPRLNHLLNIEPNQEARRHLCISITGLPPLVSMNKLKIFFKDFGIEPVAIYLLMHEKKKPAGRAYAEFSNFRDFDGALSLNGKFLHGSQVSVRQILYGEMILIVRSQRVKVFNAVNNTKSTPPIPEKAPHIWDPDKMANAPHNPPPHHDRNNIPMNEGVNFVEANNLRSNGRFLPPGNVPLQNDNILNFLDFSRQDQREFPRKDPQVEFSRQDPQVEFSRQDPQMEFLRQEHQRFPPQQVAVFEEEPPRTPLKFGMRNNSVNIIVDQAFDANERLEVKKVLTKLTPEKQLPTRTKNNANKKIKNDKPSEIIEVTITDKSKSSQSKVGPDVKKITKNSSADRKSAASSRDKDKHAKSEDSMNSSSRQRERKPPRSRSRSPDRYYRRESRRSRDRFVIQEQVVQVCDVHPSITTKDLEGLFHGFNVVKGSFVRRYENNEPSGDVRVSFRSVHEAEKAVRFLNGSYLAGYPIDMFLVTD